MNTHLTERVNGLYAREGALIPQSTKITEWDPPPHQAARTSGRDLFLQSVLMFLEKLPEFNPIVGWP